MREKDLSERLLEFGVISIRLSFKLNRTTAGRHIGTQLLCSSTSTGANYEEACNAESKADFIHKMQLVLKELCESAYWLKLVKKAKLATDESVQLLLNESEELVKIVAKSVITAKSNK